MNITVLAAVPDFILTGGLVGAGFVALILGWIIHPWTVGGFTRWVQSPMQQFTARVSTSVVSSFATVYLGGMMLATVFPHWNFAKLYDKGSTHQSTLSGDPSVTSQNATHSANQALRAPVIQAEKPAVSPPSQQTINPSVTAQNSSRDNAMPRLEPEVVESSKEKILTKSNEDGIKNAADSAQMKIAELKADLAEVETKIQSERDRWKASINVINQLTNFKKTPVREGSPQYHQCMEASRIINEVESGAANLKAQRARLEAMIQSLENR